MNKKLIEKYEQRICECNESIEWYIEEDSEGYVESIETEEAYIMMYEEFIQDLKELTNEKSGEME